MLNIIVTHATLHAHIILAADYHSTTVQFMSFLWLFIITIPGIIVSFFDTLLLLRPLGELSTHVDHNISNLIVIHAC